MSARTFKRQLARRAAAHGGFSAVTRMASPGFLLAAPRNGCLNGKAAGSRIAPMKRFPHPIRLAWLLASTLTATAAPPEIQPELPDSLKPWAGWALWNDRDLASPSPYHDPKQALRVWPSQLTLDVRDEGGRFDFAVTVFNEAWLPLPGAGDMWPVNVTANGTQLPVIEHKGNPR
jgi:hypothetical protein